MGIARLVLGDTLDEVVVRIVLLRHVQRVVIARTAIGILFLFPDYVLVVLQKLTGFVLGCRMWLILILIILIGWIAKLGSGLGCPVWNYLLHIDYATVALGLTTHHGGHHALREIMRLRNLVGQNCLR